MRSSVRASLIVGAAALAFGLSSIAPASASVFISVNTPPPALRVYEQPLCPGAGYVWTPGYWAWDGGDYYWVDGTWALAPVGMLWTPGYWGWNNTAYLWHAGYWGPHVGYYGGINYGHGYIGNGYRGGYWRGRSFYYNSTVNHVDVTRVHNVYHKTVINNVTVNRVSYNGGHGGTSARPSSRDKTYAHEHHVAMTHDQRAHEASIRTQHETHRRPGDGADRDARRSTAADQHGHPDQPHAGRRPADRSAGQTQAHVATTQHDRPQHHPTGHPQHSAPQAQAHRAPPPRAASHAGDNHQRPPSRTDNGGPHRPEPQNRH